MRQKVMAREKVKSKRQGRGDENGFEEPVGGV
jgi:hypothetical protein